MQDFLHLGQAVPETGRMQIVVGRTLSAEIGANNREWREKTWTKKIVSVESFSKRNAPGS